MRPDHVRFVALECLPTVIRETARDESIKPPFFSFYYFFSPFFFPVVFPSSSTMLSVVLGFSLAAAMAFLEPQQILVTAQG